MAGILSDGIYGYGLYGYAHYGMGSVDISDEPYIYINDTLTALRNVPRYLNELISVSEVLSRYQELFRSLSESFNVSDSVMRTLLSNRNIVQSININDTLLRSLILYRDLTESSINVSDIVYRLRNVPRTVSESLTITENFTSVFHQYEKTKLFISPGLPNIVYINKTTPYIGNVGAGLPVIGGITQSIPVGYSSLADPDFINISSTKVAIVSVGDSVPVICKSTTFV